MLINTSFVMAILNRSRLLEITLHGYRHYGPYQGVELVVADYGSTDNVRTVLEGAKDVFERIRYLILDRTKSTVPISPKFNNPAVPLNVAIKAAVAPLLIMSPPECYPLADNLRIAHTAMDAGQRKACILGKTIRPGEGTAQMLGPGKWLPRNEHDLPLKMSKKDATPFISSQKRMMAPFFMAFRKEDHERLNGFDEEYARGFAAEDTDYLLRMKRADVSHVWDDRLIVLHQWHERPAHPRDDLPKPPPGTKEGEPNWNRSLDGVRANLSHDQGSQDMIVKEITI